jgi:hypothetical protein
MPLDVYGIGCVHLQKIDALKKGQFAARSGHADEMLRISERHLATPEARRERNELAALAKASLAESLLARLGRPPPPKLNQAVLTRRPQLSQNFGAYWWGKER